MASGVPTPCPRCGATIRSVYMNTATANIQGQVVPDLDTMCITIYPCGDMACSGTTEYQTFLDAFKKAYGIP